MNVQPLNKSLILFAILVSGACLGTDSLTDSTPLTPLLTTPDFDGDGFVDDNDVMAITGEYRNITSPDYRVLPESDLSYRAFFDVNANRQIDHGDYNDTIDATDFESTDFDQELVALYWGKGLKYTTSSQSASHGIDYFGKTVNTSELTHTFSNNMTFTKVTQPIRGHGFHYLTLEGRRQVRGKYLYKDEPQEEISHQKILGLNVDENGRPLADFKGVAARPLFYHEDGVSPLSVEDDEFPQGERWKNLRVRCLLIEGKPILETNDATNGCANPQSAFPSLFNSSDESWHAHGGLCHYFQPDENGELQPHIAQLTTFNECQMYENRHKVRLKNGDMVNSWSNFLMLHVWLDRLNSNGIFGNVDPEISPNAPKEGCTHVNGRQLSGWFHSTHSHGGSALDHEYVSGCDNEKDQVRLIETNSTNSTDGSSSSATVAFASTLSLLAAVFTLSVLW